MNCKTVRTYGLALLDKELSLRRTHKIQAHLEQCAACRNALTRMASLYSAADTMRERQLPAGLWPRLSADIDAWEDRRSPWTLIGAWIPRAAAVCATAVLLLTGIAAGIYLGSGGPASATAAGQEYAAVSGLDRFDNLLPESLGMAYLVLTIPE